MRYLFYSSLMAWACNDARKRARGGRPLNQLPDGTFYRPRAHRKSVLARRRLEKLEKLEKLL